LIMIYFAHAIFYFKLLFRKNDTFFVHENVYIIDAKDLDEANESAIKLAKTHEEMNDEGYLEINEEKCAYIFVGIRKITKAQKFFLRVGTLHDISGEEMTYSVFEVDSLEKLEMLAAGKTVDEVLYRE